MGYPREGILVTLQLLKGLVSAREVGRPQRWLFAVYLQEGEGR